MTFPAFLLLLLFHYFIYVWKRFVESYCSDPVAKEIWELNPSESSYGFSVAWKVQRFTAILVAGHSSLPWTMTPSTLPVAAPVVSGEGEVSPAQVVVQLTAKGLWSKDRCSHSLVSILVYNFHYLSEVRSSVQRIVIFPANRNRNRFVDPTSVQIGIGKSHEIQNLQIGTGKIFVRREVFTNYLWIPEILFSLSFFTIFLFLDSYIFIISKNLPGKQNHRVIFSYFTNIFNFTTKY